MVRKNNPEPLQNITMEVGLLSESTVFWTSSHTAFYSPNTEVESKLIVITVDSSEKKCNNFPEVSTTDVYLEIHIYIA